MSILYVLIPLSLMVMAGAAWALCWAIDHGQFDDLDEPGGAILKDPRGAILKDPRGAILRDPRGAILKDEEPPGN